MEKLKTYLFVCKANVDRSKTAEDLCNRIAEEKGLLIKAISAGVSPVADRALTQSLANEADMIFVMEGWMKSLIEKHLGQAPGKVVSLDIPDEFRRGDVILQKRIMDGLGPYLVPDN